MSRLDCGPSLHNYTAAPGGAHLIFHQRAIAILLPSATGTGKSASEAHALVNTKKNVKVLHKSLARGQTTRKMTATIINLALRTESLPKSFGFVSHAHLAKRLWGSVRRRQNLEGVCTNTVCLLHPSGITGFVSASLASSRPPTGLVLASAAALC